jgi:hypothetical protein
MESGPTAPTDKNPQHATPLSGDAPDGGLLDTRLSDAAVSSLRLWGAVCAGFGAGWLLRGRFLGVGQGAGQVVRDDLVRFARVAMRLELAALIQ